MEIAHRDAVKAPLRLLIGLQGAVSAASVVVAAGGGVLSPRRRAARRGEAVATGIGVVAAFAVGAAAPAAPKVCDRESAYYPT